VTAVPREASARQEFVILTHVRSGSSLLADLLARNGIGDAREHLNQRVLAKSDHSWHPAEILAAARGQGRGDFFGSKVMVHWLDDLKRRAGVRTATDAQALGQLFGPGFVAIHLYRADTVAAAVSFTLAELSGRWHEVGGQAVAHPAGEGFRLPRWAALEPLISDNVAWLDSCKDRLRAVSAALAPGVTEMRYEDLSRDMAAGLRHAVAAIPGTQGRPLTAVSRHRKLADARSDELCRRWRAEHPGYALSRSQRPLSLPYKSAKSSNA
jgi:LPS sulfotransferase NodH